VWGRCTVRQPPFRPLPTISRMSRVGPPMGEKVACPCRCANSSQTPGSRQTLSSRSPTTSSSHSTYTAYPARLHPSTSSACVCSSRDYERSAITRTKHCSGVQENWIDPSSFAQPRHPFTRSLRPHYHSIPLICGSSARLSCGRASMHTFFASIGIGWNGQRIASTLWPGVPWTTTE
jgi:hypothetical protein